MTTSRIALIVRWSWAMMNVLYDVIDVILPMGDKWFVIVDFIWNSSASWPFSWQVWLVQLLSLVSPFFLGPSKLWLWYEDTLNWWNIFSMSHASAMSSFRKRNRMPTRLLTFWSDATARAPAASRTWGSWRGTAPLRKRAATPSGNLRKRAATPRGSASAPCKPGRQAAESL